MCPGGGVIAVAGHKHHIDDNGDKQSRQGNPHGVIGLAGELVPHTYVELHSQHHICHQHYGGNLQADAEILAQQQPYHVQIEHHEQEARHTEGHEPGHYLRVQRLGIFLLLPLEEERLGGIAEHLHEKRHYHRNLDAGLINAQL